MSEFREIEFKYDAAQIDMGDFNEAVHELFQVKKLVVISGYDDYFTCVNDPDQYLRHRYNADRAEVTVKRRHSKETTAIRDEVDVKVAEGQAKQVAAFAGLLGYRHDFTIYKTCQIFYLESVNLVYYVVYDANLKELRRIIEIEANKDYQGDALAAISRVERILTLDFATIGPDLRLNKTMHELFTTTKG